MELWDIYDGQRNKTGKKVVRGAPLLPGEYHLVVFAIIMNKAGEILVSRRTPNKTFPNLWEIPGGAAVSGDDSETAILREVAEEVGITFKRGSGKCVKRFVRNTEYSYFGDIWLFHHEIDLAEIVCQPEEVSEVRIVNESSLLELMEEGVFIKNEYVTEFLKTIWTR